MTTNSGNMLAHLKDDLPKQLSSSQKALLSGGVAGALAKTVTAPLSRITILYQVSSALARTPQNGSLSLSASLGVGEFSGSVFGSLTRIARTEGVFSLWKGNLTSVIHRFPFSATNFSVYESTRAAFKRVGFEEDSFVRLACGALGGGTASLACYPLDLLRTRFAVMDVMPCCGKCNMTPGTIIHTATHIVKHEGLSGLYKGCSIGIAVSVPNIAMGFTFFGKCKEILIENEQFLDNSRKNVTPIGSAVCGAIAGSISSTIVFPIDVLRRRLQVRNIAESIPSTGNKSVPSNLSSAAVPSNSSQQSISASASNERLNGFIQRIGGRDVACEARKIMQKHGVAGFYRGLAPELMKVAPNMAILFCVYEFSMNLLKA